MEYWDAIEDLAVTEVFAGDLLIKNYGVIRNDRVVFYDYDELTEMVNCRFRELPDPPSIDDAMAETPWFPLGPDDIFPAEFAFFLGLSGELRKTFNDAHAELFEASWWRRTKEGIASGEIASVYPFRQDLRLKSATPIP